MDCSLPYRNSDLTKKIENDQLTDFKYILSNQHSKQFHLIDNPDLIFQLAQYKFDKGQSYKANTQSQKSINKKLYRHKSQEGIAETESIHKNSQFPIQNSLPFPNKKLKLARTSFTQDSHEANPNIPNSQPKKIQLNAKEKSFTSKAKSKQYFSKIEFKNAQQKENLHAKILNATRPSTSNISNLKNASSKQPDMNLNWKKVFERKKYLDLKAKLESLIKNVQNCQELNFSEVFEYEQLILKDYLNSLVTELKKECIEKGELIQMIWNAFFALIDKIMKILVSKNNIAEKTKIQQQINLHQGYQDMYVYEANKIIELGKKYNESKNVIDRLIYELRFKRKEAKKLYKSLAICNQKINQYKIQHIDLQNLHIDLLMQSKQMEEKEATEILKRKMQVNRQKYMKLRVGNNKEKMKQQIEKQILSEQVDPQDQELFKKELFEKINSFKGKKKKCPIEQKQQSHFVDEFIQRFSNKFIQLNDSGKQSKIKNSIRKPQRMSTAINTEIYSKGKNELIYSATQTTFSDKLQFNMIDHRSTQTTGFQKVKKFESVQVQADGDQMKIVLTKAKMMAYKTMDLSFYFDVKKRDQRSKQKILRNSQLSVEKQHQLNQSASQISSEEFDETPKEIIKKRSSKNDLTLKREKKLSGFSNTLPNSSSVKKRSSKGSNGKQENSSKVHKKRTSEIQQILQSRFLSEFKQQQMAIKKRTLQNPSSFDRIRGSICLSNVDSVIEHISISEEKEKFIENYIMSKDQEFQIVEDNAIFDTFKNHIKGGYKRKALFNKSYANKEIAYSKILQVNNSSFQQRDSQEQADLLNSKEPLTSLSKIQKIKGTHKQFQLSTKKTHGQSRSSIDQINGSNEFKLKKENLKETLFLNNVIQFTIKKSLMKKKIDASNFQACKEKSQFTSITEKLDPFMLDVQFLVNQGSVKKRKQSSINIKAANRFLMMTYSRSIDKIYRNNAILQNLIKPLFESFEVIYGALKPNEIYKKMVTFISDIFSFRENQSFKEFIFFLGMDKNNIHSAYLTTFDVCLYLKLIEKLNIGGKIGSQIQSVFTSKTKVISDLVNILEAYNISPEVIMIVSGKINILLEKLEEFVRESMPSNGEETKINLFKVSKMIVEEIIKLRVHTMNKLEMYMTGSQLKIDITAKDIQKTKNALINVNPIQKIVQCCRIPTSKKLYFSKYIEELCSKSENCPPNKKIIKRSELGVLLIRIGLVNFDEVQERIKLIANTNEETTVNQKGEIQHNANEIQLNNFSRNLDKLLIVETECNSVLENILGDIMIAYEIGLIKNLQGSKDKLK